MAVQLHPTHANTRLELGNALEQLGKRAEALGELQKALKLDPGLRLARQKIEELKTKLNSNGPL